VPSLGCHAVVTNQRSDPPPASSEAARAVMVANRGRDTGPELAVRRLLHRAGLRYRIDHPLDLGSPVGRRRRADIAFPRRQVAVFIDGCFWHGCPEHHAAPRTNAAFWRAKVNRNRQRDQETDGLLTEVGWVPMRFWEHEDPADVAKSIMHMVRRRASA
jgi:DNA mismatch endonuclease, patch repair protein